MTDREREKALLDKLLGLKETDTVRTLIELLELRLAKHKDNLLLTEDGTVRGRGLECRELLKFIRGNGE